MTDVTEVSFQIPKPLTWQAQLLSMISEASVRSIVAVVGRRAGKTHAALLAALTSPKGLLAGYDVAWLGPSDKVIAESKAWFKAWCAPVIVGASPGDLGYALSNGSAIDWWPAGPNAKQPVRSRGYGMVVVDEAAFIPNLKLLVDASVRPALAIDEGVLMLIGTPYGKAGSDFYDFYLEAKNNGVAFHGPSSINPHLKASELEKLKRTTDELTFRQEYGAEFLDRAGSLLKANQIRKGTPPALELFKTIAFGLDIALSSKQRADYTALVVSGVDDQDRHWILAAFRWRADWPTTFERVLRFNEQWHPHVIQTEQVAFQELAIREMIDVGLPVTAIKPSTDKETRFAPIHLRYSLGQVWHAENLDPEFERELLSFPQSQYDDQCDAAVFAVTALDRRMRTACATEINTGECWGGRLPHEKKRKVRMYFGFGGSQYEDVEVSDDGVASSAPRLVMPAFTEQFVGDTLIVTAADGRDLMRIERGKSHLYFQHKMAGKLPWQVQQPNNG